MELALRTTSKTSQSETAVVPSASDCPFPIGDLPVGVLRNIPGISRFADQLCSKGRQVSIVLCQTFIPVHRLIYCTRSVHKIFIFLIKSYNISSRILNRDDEGADHSTTSAADADERSVPVQSESRGRDQAALQLHDKPGCIPEAKR